MRTPDKPVVDYVQELLGRGVRIFPKMYYEFLENLMEMERDRKLCLLPSPRFELYHMRLERKVRERIEAHRRVA